MKSLSFGILKFIMSLCIILFVSCHDKDVKLPDINTEKVYSGSELKISYCNEQMPGKICRFTPIPGEPGKATLSLFSELDLSQLNMGLSGTVNAQGVLPGEPLIEIPVTLVPSEDRYTFASSGTTEYCSYNLNGYIAESGMVLNIPDVTLHDTTLAGTVIMPSPLKVNSESGGYESTPFHLLWDINPAAGIEIDLTGILEAFVTLPVVPVNNGMTHLSLSELLVSTLKTGAFLPSGNMVFRYVSSSDGAAQMFTSVGNAVQYVVISPTRIWINVNPLTAYARWLVIQSGNHIVDNVEFVRSDSKETLIKILSPVVMNFVGKLLPLLSTGVELTYDNSVTKFDTYLSTVQCVSLLTDLFQSIASSPEISSAIKELIATHPYLSHLLPEVEELLAHVPEVLTSTTTVELGFSYIKYRQ